MQQVLHFGPLPAEERETFAALVGAALHETAAHIQRWMDRAGVENFRALWQNGQMVAGVGLLSMGQWFGGACVPTVGVTAVGVALEYRGTGVGKTMMQQALAEVRAAGVPLCTLYPATVMFYRRVGFERAGQRITYEMPVDALHSHESSLDLVRVEGEPYDELYRAYEQQARQATGNIARPPSLWQRKLQPPDALCFRYLVQRAGQTEGYVIFTQSSDQEPILVRDLCVLTPAAGRRLLSLFARYRSQVQRLLWSGGPLDPFAYLVNEPIVGSQPYVVRKSSIDWMLRIIDVVGALSARGYPPGVQAELHFDIADELFEANNGRFVLQVADGQAQVVPGGAGRIRLGIGELAALYSGFMTPAELRLFGNIAGPETDLALSSVVFAGPRPWMSDIF